MGVLMLECISNIRRKETPRYYGKHRQMKLTTFNFNTKTSYKSELNKLMRMEMLSKKKKLKK